MISILFGIGSALSWGAADFTGGLASKRALPSQVLVVAEIAGLLPVAAALLFWREAVPPLSAWLWSAAAGGLGTIGLLLFYRALADGQMAVAAPVSALLAAVVPVVAGALMAGLPDLLKFLGIALALAAIWTIAQGGQALDRRIGFQDLRLPLAAGIFFGLFFVLMHQAAIQAVVWPLISGRIAGASIVLIYGTALQRRSLKAGDRSIWPPRDVWPIAIFSGVIDVTGSAFYVLAARGGRMDIAAVLAALYPASTVILARLFLGERASPRQVAGILLALGAITLMTI